MSDSRATATGSTDPHPSLDDRKPGQRGLKTVLRVVRACLPGDWVRTFVYLNAISKPRKLLRRATTSLYRIDHVYDVLREFTREFQGPFSILEFGTAQGYAFAKLLYATRYLGVENRVFVHGFDSFEGLPKATNAEDRGFTGNDWMEGAYLASYETLKTYCEKQGHKNFRLHKGYFENTLTDVLLSELREQQPILVWVDCDLYTSSRTVIERLMPVLPTGCVIYFDDIEFNYHSRFTGQARLVHEINLGKFGDDVELVLDTELSWDSPRICRFIRYGDRAITYRPLSYRTTPPVARPIADGSPFP
jgi:Macrocin-O-methyltransferase (TylF)